jgi:hypothetical protein
MKDMICPTLKAVLGIKNWSAFKQNLNNAHSIFIGDPVMILFQYDSLLPPHLKKKNYNSKVNQNGLKRVGETLRI